MSKPKAEKVKPKCPCCAGYWLYFRIKMKAFLCKSCGTVFRINKDRSATVVPS